MAVYEPRLGWLREQLVSLNEQTYPNLELLVCDDCSPTVPFSEIQALLSECISAFPYALERNPSNLGSTGTFEKLTEQAKGEYIAYCDQDDVWLPEKLEKLFHSMIASGSLLVCSDMYIIDEAGRQTADSISTVRKRHVFKAGEGLAQELLYQNFVTGCTMLVQARMAKAAVPFPSCMVHDHWLAIWCASNGKILSLPERLVNYRIHSANQTLVLAGVNSKKDYYERRIMPFFKRTREISRRLSVNGIEQAMKWAEARKDYFNRIPGAGRKLWKLRQVNRSMSVFELLMLRAPLPVFLLAVRMIQKGVI
jgi:glycosyltransferase involved in cell wall biosynthesis